MITDDELIERYGTEGAKIARDAIDWAQRAIPFSERPPKHGDWVWIWDTRDNSWRGERWLQYPILVMLGYWTHWLPQSPDPTQEQT